jgi:hypothetical protein
MVGYTALVRKAWKQKAKVLVHRHSGSFQLCLFILGLGLGLVIASVAGDFSQWWVVGIVMLVAVQVIAFSKALR